MCGKSLGGTVLLNGIGFAFPPKKCSVFILNSLPLSARLLGSLLLRVKRST